MIRRSKKVFPLRCERRSFAFLVIAFLVIIVTWFNVSSYQSGPRFIDHTLFSNEKVFSVSEDLFFNSSKEQIIKKCDPKEAILKVFMYDLPPEFHFGLLGWKPKGDEIWPDSETEIPRYPGGLNLQHSIEYWLTLDILNGPCNVERVTDYRAADVIFVPFFASLSYNIQSKAKVPEKMRMNKLLQAKLVKLLTAREEWKRSGGRDHLIVAHHPNSLLDARMELRQAMFILADFGRYHPTVANVEKDVIAPYKHIVKTFVNDSSGFHGRPTLLYFQGAIVRKSGGKIRQQLFQLLKDEPNVNFSSGAFGENGVHETTKGMRSSKFCLHVAGDTPSSNRLFDAIASHCIPVIISDDIELPYEDILDYSEFCIFIKSSDAIKKNFIIEVIRSVREEEWIEMWKRLKEVVKYFELRYPSEKDDAVQMMWQAVARKAASVRHKVNKAKRFSQNFGVKM